MLSLNILLSMFACFKNDEFRGQMTTRLEINPAIHSMSLWQRHDGRTVEKWRLASQQQSDTLHLLKYMYNHEKKSKCSPMSLKGDSLTRQACLLLNFFTLSTSHCHTRPSKQHVICMRHNIYLHICSREFHTNSWRSLIGSQKKGA